MWKKAVVLEEVKDFNSMIILFKKGEEITVTNCENRMGYNSWVVVNHKFRNGFIFGVGTIEILGDAYK
jgi:hypothetical protein